MKRLSRKNVWRAVGFSAAQLLSVSLFAQNPTNPPSPPASDSVATARPALLLPSPTKPPVEFFRELLAMRAADRAKAISNRTAENQQRILDKVREYELLSPEARELRLRVTELRWYLLQLMPVAPANRNARLAHIPPDLRTLVEDRLKVWDTLPATQQQRLLENQPALASLADRMPPHPFLRTNASPAQPSAEIQHWRALPKEQREEIMGSFNKFFVLTAEERDKTLKSISDPERRQIEKTLKTFENLPPSRRDRCIASLEEFADLNLEERQEFFQSVERWKEMTPSQREAWRELVARYAAQPLLPSLRKRPPPPRITELPREPLATVAGTNQN